MDKIRQMQLLLAKIPRGKVTTYGIIARKLGVHPRQAGYLLSRNPDGVKYPCYRVILSSGKVGNYSGKGGTRGKELLLRKDGITVKNSRIDLKKHLFRF